MCTSCTGHKSCNGPDQPDPLDPTRPRNKKYKKKKNVFCAIVLQYAGDIFLFSPVSFLSYVSLSAEPPPRCGGARAQRRRRSHCVGAHAQPRRRSRTAEASARNHGGALSLSTRISVSHAPSRERGVSKHGFVMEMSTCNLTLPAIWCVGKPTCLPRR